jgi:hypothetical protein
MIPCDQAQNTLHHNIVNIAAYGPYGKGACCEDVQCSVTDDTDCGSPNPK